MSPPVWILASATGWDLLCTALWTVAMASVVVWVTAHLILLLATAILATAAAKDGPPI